MSQKENQTKKPILPGNAGVTRHLLWAMEDWV